MKSQYILPITIVVAGGLIAGAVFLVGQQGGGGGTGGGEPTIRPVDSSDHIIGNPEAPIMLVEYADLECQFCKEFHTTMHQVIDYYGENGQVAWVFRHFPLVQLHAKAPQEAEAAECAAEQGGSEAFFKFIDHLYEVTPSNNGLDLAQLPTIAADVGLDGQALQTCLSSGRYTDKVTQSYTEAIAAGGRGTPYTLVLIGGKLVEGGALGGAQPYDSMRAIVDEALQQLQGAPILQTP